MSIKTNELQQTTALKGADSLLLADSAAGTAQLSLANLAKFLTEQDNAVKTALSNKAALSAQQTVELTEVPSRHVPLAASELQAYINALPRLLTEHLYLEPTGKLDTAVEVNNFYGPGGLTIVGNRGFSMRNALRIQNCSLSVIVHTIEFQERADIGSVNAIMVYAERSGQVRIYNCGFTGLGAESVARAVTAQMNSAIQMTRVRISGFYNAVMSDCGSILSIGNSEGENISEFSGNAVGAYVWGGGIVLLGAGIPDLLGGNAHQKFGGIIAKSDGTLL